jgi:hypothetical protein
MDVHPPKYGIYRYWSIPKSIRRESSKLHVSIAKASILVSVFRANLATIIGTNKVWTHHGNISGDLVFKPQLGRCSIATQVENKVYGIHVIASREKFPSNAELMRTPMDYGRPGRPSDHPRCGSVSPNHPPTGIAIMIGFPMKITPQSLP